MKKILYSILGLTAMVSVASCDKFLTVEPINEVSAETFLSNEQELKLFANGLINEYRPDADDIASGDNGTDLIAKRDPSKFWFTNDVYKPVDRGAWEYKSIRRANVLIINMERARKNVSGEVFNHYQGVGRFWRAYHHWGKVKAYGDIPWQEILIDPKDTVNLYAPRDDREFVVHKIVEDLQFAAENCFENGASVSKGEISRYVAAAYLANVALYEGTYRKYHNVNYSTMKPWNNEYETADELLQIAANACELIMNSGKFSLNGSYKANFTTEDLMSNPEMIWVSEYSTGENAVTHSLTSDFRGSTVGGPSPTKEYVNNFLMSDGTPIVSDQISLWQELGPDNGRDPRLMDCVNHVGLTYKSISGETYKKWMPCNLTYSGYNCTKWNIEEEVQFQVAKCGNSIPLLRYAQVLIDYAEAKGELNGGVIDQAVWDQTIGAVRKRAGMKNTGKPASMDERLYKYYADAYDYEEGDIQGNRAAELKAHLTTDLIEARRERVCELGFEGVRYDDLVRWHCLSIVPMRNTNGTSFRGIWVSKDDFKNGFFFNENYVLSDEPGTGSYDLVDGKYVEKAGGNYNLFHGKVTFGTKAGETTFAIANSGASQSYSLSEGDHGYLLFHYDLAWDKKKYLYPINSSSVLVNNLNIVQNELWK